MGRAIDLFVTYRFIKLLVTPFEKQEAYKLGIIDKDGNRVMPPPDPKTGIRRKKAEPLFVQLRLKYTMFSRGIHDIWILKSQTGKELGNYGKI